MKTSVNIGIVGLGRLGKRHAENLASRVPGAKLVAAVSPVPSEREWAQTNLGLTSIYDSLEALLSHPDLDAVWLVTPTSLHAEQIEIVLKAGKHVFCEKPLSLDLNTCDRVLSLAQDHPNQVAMIGFMRRFDAGYAAAKSRLSEGKLGTLYRIHCESHDPIDPDGFFVKFAPTSGGIFLDCCIHDIDLVRWMVDGSKPVRVFANGTRTQYPGLAACNDVDTANATVEFENGVLASFFVSRTSYRGYEATMDLTGTEGALRVGRNLQAVPLIEENNQQQHVSGLPDFFARFNDAFLIEAKAFVDTILTGKKSPLTLEDAREAAKIAIAMRDALESGQVINLN
ncbi:Gfo/Idh/MocA family oxidoreductase [Leeia sp. TBRC 13508]|uniref:Gfo/Idh/MocA family oxidoreductase n=1 Tax=Leeia speluncae TaxID=2884804 RepID=A0ABS8DAU4_9NEIS|nr:Gfo/Idh/MocA family oxidoreductase [Leeia speluncae]MCB6185339.1 Gfo/Idh/MocA family oxidoreductase [Leeia speluncae]